MTDLVRGTLKSIMIVDDHESILYSLVEVFEGKNSVVHSVVSDESPVKALEDDFAAVKRIGLSTEELGDVLMKLLPDTDTLSRFRNRWNPFVRRQIAPCRAQSHRRYLRLAFLAWEKLICSPFMTRHLSMREKRRP